MPKKDHRAHTYLVAGLQIADGNTKISKDESDNLVLEDVNSGSSTLGQILSPGGYPGSPFTLATKARNIDIYVDPILGSDAPGNYGLNPSSPLKTLARAAEVIPQYAYGVIVHLAAGTYSEGRIELASASGYFNSLTLIGELVPVTTFDTYAAVTSLDVTKDPGTPAWTVNEHKGRIVTWSQSGREFYHFVISNDAHSLKLTWGPPAIGGSQWPFYNPNVGSTFTINDLGSIIDPPGSGPVIVPAGDMAFQYIHFNTGTTPISPAPTCRQIGVKGCKFSSASYGYFTQTNTRAYFLACWFENMSSYAIWAIRGASYVQAVNNYYENCPRAIGVGDGAYLLCGLGSFLFAKGCLRIIVASFGTRYDDGLEGVWAVSCGTYVELSYSSTYIKSSEFLKNLENSQLTTYLFNATKGGNTLNFVDKTGGAGNTLNTVSGNDFSIEGVAFNWNTFQTLYALNYSDVKGNRVLGAALNGLLPNPAQFARKKFPATCLPTDSVGNCVYIRGGLDPEDKYQVEKANPTSDTKMPAIGIIIEKETTTSCVVQWGGELPGLSGLMPGGLVFVGIDANLQQAPIPNPPLGEYFFVQQMGTALSAETVILNSGAQMVKKVG